MRTSPLAALLVATPAAAHDVDTLVATLDAATDAALARGSRGDAVLFAAAADALDDDRAIRTRSGYLVDVEGDTAAVVVDDPLRAGDTVTVWLQADHVGVGAAPVDAWGEYKVVIPW